MLLCRVLAWVVLCPHKGGYWAWKGRPPSHSCGHPFLGSAQPLWKQMSSPAANGHRDTHLCQSRGTKCWHPDLKGRRGEADLLQEVPVRGRGRGGAVVPGGGGGESRTASRHMEKPNSSSALKLSATHIADITWIFLTPCSTTPHLHAESWLLPPGMGEACPASHTHQQWSQDDHCPHSQAHGLPVA